MNRDLFAASGVGGGVVEATTDPYFNSTTLLLSGDGTNGAQNNTFVDSSTNNATITRSGTPTQGSFSPFSQTGWSGYFNGTSDYLTTPSTAGFAMGTGDFTIEGWVYPVAGSSGGILQISTTAGGFQTATNTSGFALAMSTTNSIVIAINAQNLYTSTNKLPFNTWTHLALVRNSGVVKLYINGVLETSIGTSGSIADTTNYTTTYMVIGGYYNTSYVFNGYISNLRITKGTAVYTGNFTPPTAPLTATQSAGTNIAAITGTATSLLTLQDNRFKDNALTPSTITATGTPSVQAFSPFAPTAAYSVPAAAAGSAYFNGSSYLTVPDNAIFNLSVSNWSIEGWAYCIGGSGYRTFIDKRPVSGAAADWEIGINDTGYLYFYTSGVALGSTLVPINSWFHFAATYDGTNTRMFLNGVVVYTVGANLATSSANPVFIGCSCGNGQFFPGYISNLRIVKGTAVYTGAFTPSGTPLSKIQSAGTNIAALSGTETSLLTLQDSTFKDNSVNVATITASATPPVIQSFTPFTQVWGGSFNGTTDYISVPDSTAFTMGSGDFTLEAWVYLTTSGVSRAIIGTCDAAGSAGSMSFVLGVNASNNVTFAIGYAGALYTSTNTATVPTNQWIHIAGVRNGGGIYAYLNGIQSTSNTSMASLAITDSTQVVAIGRNGAYNGEYVTGYISNVRIVKGTAVYTGAFTPPAKTLSATQVAGTNISAITGTATSLLTLQDPTFKDNATTPNTITTGGSPKAQLRSAPFTGSAAGSAWNISVTAPLATVGGSMYLNGGTVDYLALPAGSAFAPGLGPFTVEGWYYATATSGSQFIWAQTVSGSNYFIVSFDPASSQFTFIGLGYPVYSPATVKPNCWNHFAVVRDATNMTVYANGVAGSPVAFGTGYNFNNTTYVPVISGYTHSQTAMMTGYLSNFRYVKGTAVYTGNFTPPTAPPQPTQTAGLLGTNVNAIDGTNTSLLLLGSNAGIYDATAKNDIITVGDTKVSSTQIKYGTGAMYFDGTGDYLTLPASTNWMFGTGDFTVEFWINTAGANSQILSLVGGTAAGNWQISIYNSSIYWQSARNTTDTYIVSSTAISNSAWHHVAYCRTSNALKVYFDGVAQGAGISDATNYSISSVLNVGYSSSYFTGYLDDLRITKYARYPGSAFPTKAMIGQ